MSIEADGDESAIYSRCLDCGSERIKITGEPKFVGSNIVTCRVCGGFWRYDDFQRANMKRIDELLKVGGKPN